MLLPVTGDWADINSDWFCSCRCGNARMSRQNSSFNINLHDPVTRFFTAPLRACVCVYIQLSETPRPSAFPRNSWWLTVMSRCVCWLGGGVYQGVMRTALKLRKKGVALFLTLVSERWASGSGLSSLITSVICVWSVNLFFLTSGLVICQNLFILASSELTGLFVFCVHRAKLQFLYEILSSVWIRYVTDPNDGLVRRVLSSSLTTCDFIHTKHVIRFPHSLAHYLIYV